MAQINHIRDLRNMEGLSIAEIARKLNVNWRTARKYADGEVFARGARGRCWRPVLGPYTEVIDDWLEEDTRMPAKQRRTARKVFRELVELGYQGSERTVRAYVRESRRRLRGMQIERCSRLDHEPGEAQVDFGDFKVVTPEGNIWTYHLQVMSFPYSNGALARILPAANTECFLHGLKSMFEQAGGVPKEIWFDNLTPAVKEILGCGERNVTEAFDRFRWHYRFKAKFCNPAAGHEKGSVENKVGYIRRNYLTPMPTTEDIAELNRRLSRDLELDRDRPHYRKEASIAELWEDDLGALLALPTAEFEVYRPVTAVVNRVCEVKVEGQYYHVPRATPGQRVLIKLCWDRLDVYDITCEQELGSCPRHYAFRADRVDWAAELRVLCKKPRAVERATYVKALPRVLREFILCVDIKERRGRMKSLVSLFEAGCSLRDIEETVRLAMRYKVADAASLRAMAAYRSTAHDCPTPLFEPHTPDPVRNWRPELARYNLLLGGGESK